MITDVELQFRKYRVQVRSVAGMYAQYDGHIDIWSSSADPQVVHDRAFDQLRRTAFPDRGRDCWKFGSIEPLR